jgi:tetratricopeptide (TPR) repeat protein
LTILIVFSAITINGAGYWKNNLKLFERGVITSPNSSKTHYNLGQEYWRLAKNNNSYSNENTYAIKAIEEFKKSISILPGNYLSVTNLACVYELANQLDSSVYFFNASKKLNPNQKLIETNISAVYFKKATQFEVSKMIDSAEANYKIALQYNPSNSLASNNLALISYNKNNIVEAINILKQAIKKDSTDITLVESLSAIFFLTQDYKSAIEYGTIGLSINPQSRKIIGVLADANHALGNNEEVVKYQNMMSTIR